jgi:hypothetical protein
MECTKDGFWIFTREDEAVMDLYYETAYGVLKDLLFLENAVSADRSWEKAVEIVCGILESHIKNKPPIEGDIREFLNKSPLWKKVKKRKIKRSA